MVYFINVDRWTTCARPELSSMHHKCVDGWCELLDFLIREVGGMLHEAGFGLSSALRAEPQVPPGTELYRKCLPDHTCDGPGVASASDCPACVIIAHWDQERTTLLLAAQQPAAPGLADIPAITDDADAGVQEDDSGDILM